MDKTPGLASNLHPQPQMKDTNARVSGSRTSSATQVFAGEELHKDGVAWSPFEKNKSELGDQQRLIPVTIYTAGLLVYLNSPNVKSGWFQLNEQIIPALIFTVIVQFTFSIYLRHSIFERRADDPESEDESNDLARTCYNSDIFLTFVALSTFVAFSLKSFAEIWETYLWLQLFDNAEEHESLKLRKFKAADGSAVTRPVTGITRSCRIGALVLCVVWFFVSLVTFWAGAGAVLHSKNNYDLVLNAVAAVFILEIDEHFYNLFIPPTLRLLTEGIPPLNHAGEIKEGGCRMSRKQILSKYVVNLMLIIILLARITDSVWCHEDSTNTNATSTG